MKREEVEALSEESKTELILLLFAKLTELTERVAELEAQIKANSRNSGKPPSTDGLGNH